MVLSGLGSVRRVAAGAKSVGDKPTVLCIHSMMGMQSLAAQATGSVIRAEEETSVFKSKSGLEKKGYFSLLQFSA